MIQLQNIRCGYGKNVILSDVNLTIDHGKLTCLLGRNGAGKTTLFKTILGMLQPFEGTVLLHNKSLHSYTHKELAKKISYVPQVHGSPFSFTVLDIVLMGQYAHIDSFLGIPNKKHKAIALDCIKTLGIYNLTHKHFSKLSGGEKQMVLIARAMAQQPTFIAMDEPTSNLDLGNQSTVMQLAHLLKKQGFGVIMNTHAPEQALNHADHVVLLQNGGIKASGKPYEIINSKVISEVYNTNIELVTAQASDGKSRLVCVHI